VLNWIFLLLIAAAVITGAFTDRMKDVTDASFASAKAAVDLAIGLVGQMALWLGFMRILQDAGLMRAIGRAMKPIMRRLFPDVPAEHPAMGAIIMNLAANMAGVGNAATPFGLKAMQELNKLNRHRGVATNAMALFLAINTAGVAMLPLGAIAVRATLGSKDPAGIIIPSMLATSITTVVGIIFAKLLQGLPIFAPERSVPAVPLAQAEAEGPETIGGLEQAEETATKGLGVTRGRLIFAGGAALLLGAALVLHLLGWKIERMDWRALHPVLASIPSPGGTSAMLRAILSDWLLPVLMVAIVFFGFAHQVKVYESFISGAKEGFTIAVTIIPYLVAILAAVGMFRASGGLDALVGFFGPVTERIGIPAAVLPMAFMKPLSGNGALGIMMDTMKTYGPDSSIGYMVSVMNAGTETTFYVLAVYYGSVQIRAIRHTLAACLIADTVGLSGAVYLSRAFFG
jgi:spore maturation protein SpmA